jgi:acyl dehydratase
MQEPGTGIDWLGVLHGEQSLTLHAPIPSSATVVGRSRVTAVVDKGTKGAVVYTERTITDQGTGTLLASVGMATFCRGVGGFSGGDEPPAAPTAVPDRAPDLVHDLPTTPQSALLYRLCGDRNPLHVDPAVAARAGFERPILHGLCTFGVAAHALIAAVANYEPAALRTISARFSAPVFPGELLRTEIWQGNNDTVRFRVRATDRDVIVLDRGTAELRNPNLPREAMS